MGQQVSLTRTHKTFKIDTWRVSETSIYDLTSVITLRSPDAFLVTHFSHRVSGNLVWSPHDQPWVRVAPCIRTERALLNWIPVSSLLDEVRLNDPVHVKTSWLKSRRLFVASVYAFPEVKDNFYRELPPLLWNVLSTNDVVTAGDFNAQLGYLGEE